MDTLTEERTKMDSLVVSLMAYTIRSLMIFVWLGVGTAAFWFGEPIIGLIFVVLADSHIKTLVIVQRLETLEKGIHSLVRHAIARGKADGYYDDDELDSLDQTS